MSDPALIFITLGATFLLGLAADSIGRRTKLPRVTMLLILGFLVGPSGFDLLPEGYEGPFQRASEIALTMVGFLLGERLIHSLRGGGATAVMMISITAVVVTAVIVFVGLSICGVPAPTALLLAGISTATAPAATFDVIRQLGAKSRFSETLQGVVAVDDAWGLICFSLLMALAAALSGDANGAWDPLQESLWEIGGAIGIGGFLGIVMAYLTGRIAKGEPTLLEAVGIVLLAGGLAIWAGVSFILTAMVLGAVVALRAKHHEYPFHAIERIELPFMILFFTFAGASLDIGALRIIGGVGIAYVLLRAAGRLAGGRLGAKLAKTDSHTRRGIGLALMPQAGVALGMALLAAQRFPEQGPAILTIAIGSTVFFELVGPILTRAVLVRAEQAVTRGAAE